MVLRYEHYDAPCAGSEASQVYVSIRPQLRVHGEVRTKKIIATATPMPRKNLVSMHRTVKKVIFYLSL